MIVILFLRLSSSPHYRGLDGDRLTDATGATPRLAAGTQWRTAEGDFFVLREELAFFKAKGKKVDHCRCGIGGRFRLSFDIVKAVLCRLVVKSTEKLQRSSATSR
jgi:hypothetical protein